MSTPYFDDFLYLWLIDQIKFHLKFKTLELKFLKRNGRNSHAARKNLIKIYPTFVAMLSYITIVIKTTIQSKRSNCAIVLT